MKIINLYISLQMLLLVFNMKVVAQNPPQNVIDDIQNILNSARTTQQSPGAVLSINAVGRWNYTWGSGVRDVVTNTPVTGIERFRAGSVTKNFTATSILKLASQGILNLDDPISLWLPPTIMNVIPNGNLITIRNLLNHTSGMADYVNDPNNTIVGVFINDPFTQFSIEDIMTTYFAPLNPTGVPSTSTFSYTNTGYALLGKIIESTSGLSYKQYFQQNIFSPLNLTNTSVPATGEYDISGIHLNGYFASQTNPYNDITLENTSWANSAGEIISTAPDLNKYFKNLLEGNIIPISYVNMMTNFSSTNAGYGFGCYQIEADGVQWYGHNGGIPGYGTNMFYSPTLNTYVSNNYNYEDADINPILLEINTYLNNTLSINQNSFNSITSSIYPNPSNDFIRWNYKNDFQNDEIYITDLTGKKIIEIKNYEINSQIDISKLENGIYFISSSKNKSISTKFIKN